jgi:hypothetical protein
MGSAMTNAVNNNHTVRRAMAWGGGLILIAIAANLHLHFL